MTEAISLSRTNIAPTETHTLLAKKENELPSLYRAQQNATATLASTWFPCYDAKYIQAQHGLKGKFFWVYSKLYNGAALVGQGVHKIISAVNYISTPIVSAGNFLIGKPIDRIRNAVFPINPINGKRRFVGIPRSIEKFLGDWIIYPLNTFQYRKLQPSPGSLAEKVNNVFNHLQSANQELLNPKGVKTPFNYRIQTVHSPQINAFAVPGGGMVIFSQLVKELQAAIDSKEIREVKVSFADGSTAKVNVSNVTLEDALAAVLGHEMTHVASRHSMASIVLHCICSVLASVSSFVFLQFLKVNDTQYQTLKNKEPSKLSEEERKALNKKENFYASLYNLFQWAEDKIQYLFTMLNSRKHEYEADVTGAYFSRQAGFNPLGALYLQEFFLKNENFLSDFLHKHFEMMFTHPYEEIANEPSLLLSTRLVLRHSKMPK